MPYYFDNYEEPKSDTDWDELEEIWNLIKHELLEVNFETKEEALEQKHRPHKDEQGERFLNWKLIPYRKTNDYEQLRYFHELGLEAIGCTEYFIQQRNFGAKFVYYWGMLAACHGYVLSAALASGNDLSRELSGIGSRKALNLDQQRQWFSHHFFRPEIAHLNREDRTARIGTLVHWIIDNDPEECREWKLHWFERMLNLKEGSPLYGQISGAFRDKKLPQRKMRVLLDQPTDELPPLNLPFPER